MLGLVGQIWQPLPVERVRCFSAPPAPYWAVSRETNGGCSHGDAGSVGAGRNAVELAATLSVGASASEESSWVFVGSDANPDSLQSRMVPVVALE